MELMTTIDQAKYNAFRWRYGLSIPRKLTLAFVVAGMVGLLAQVKLTNPLMPDIPITGQTFAVLLSAVFLGKRWGGISMLIFAGLGWAGLPWFAGWMSGITVSGGYIVGFILAALFLGHFTDKYIRARSFFSMLGLMLFANFVLIWIPGIIWRTVWMNTIGGQSVTIIATLVGSVTYIPGDIIKAAAAAAIARGVTPKTAYNGEVDRDKWASWRLP